MARHARTSESQLSIRFGQFRDRIQDMARLAPEPVQFENQELIELVTARIFQQPDTCRALFEGRGSSDAVIGVFGVNGKLMQIAIAGGEVPLRNDGLPLALFFGGNAEVNGDGHQDTFLTLVVGVLATRPR
jgi:hypothetical protein